MALRHSGLTGEEIAKLQEVRRFFCLPSQPTDSSPAIIGIVVTPDGRELPLRSGAHGGPWGGVHRGFNHVVGVFTPMCGTGSGMTRYNRTHIETHAAAIMHEHNLQEATLLIEKEPCKSCAPNLFKIIPVGSRLTVVSYDFAETYWSSRG